MPEKFDLNDYQRAEQLYDSGKYLDAMTICTQIVTQETAEIKGNPNYDRELFFWTEILAARIMMIMASWNSWAERKELYEKTAIVAMNSAKDLNAVIEADYQLRCTLKEWEGRLYLEMLEQMQENVSFDSWRSYLNFKSEVMVSTTFTLTQIRNADRITELCSERNLSFNDFEKLCKEKDADSCFPAEAVNDQTYLIGKAFFENTKAAIEKNKYASGQFLSVFGTEALMRLYAAKTIIQSCVDDNIKDNDRQLRNLKAKAEVQEYLLNAKLHPNGGTLSLVSSDRGKAINELKSTYVEIQKIDSNFQMPQLPKENGEASPANSGGCYIATAVYGSYDCPQVWTLRRYRDYTLAETWYGRAFVHAYYAISPTIVKWFGNARWFRKLWRNKFDRMVQKLNDKGIKDTPYADRPW